MSNKQKLNEVSEVSLDSTAMLNDMLAYKREELVKAQQAVLLEQSVLNQTKQEIESVKRQAKTDAQIAAQQATDLLRQQSESLQSERKNLERLDLELASRRKDVEVLEAQAAPIAKDKAALRDERLQIEQQRVRVEELRREHDRVSNAMSSQREEIDQLRAVVLKERAAVQTQASEQEQQANALALREKDVALQVENLTALKDTIDPKLSECDRLQEHAAADKAQAELLRKEVAAREAELAKQQTDLSILSGQLKAKSDALIEFDTALKRTEAELRIKTQQAKVAGVEVEMPPKPVELASAPAKTSAKKA